MTARMRCCHPRRGGITSSARQLRQAQHEALGGLLSLSTTSQQLDYKWLSLGVGGDGGV